MYTKNNQIIWVRKWGYVLMPFIFCHIPQLLPPVGTDTDLTPLITYQDKKLKCLFLLDSFAIWLFRLRYVCQAFWSWTIATNRSCKSAKISEICSISTVVVQTITEKRESDFNRCYDSNGWETKPSVSGVGCELLLGLICMAPHVSEIEIWVTNESLRLVTALIPAAVLWWEAEYRPT